CCRGRDAGAPHRGLRPVLPVLRRRRHTAAHRGPDRPAVLRSVARAHAHRACSKRSASVHSSRQSSSAWPSPMRIGSHTGAESPSFSGIHRSPTNTNASRPSRATGTTVETWESKVADPGGAKSRQSLHGPAGVGAVAYWLSFVAQPLS